MRREINYIPREKPHLVTRTLPEVALNVLRANCVLAEGNWGVTRLGATNCQNLFPFTALIAAFFSPASRTESMPGLSGSLLLHGIYSHLIIHSQFGFLKRRPLTLQDDRTSVFAGVVTASQINW